MIQEQIYGHSLEPVHRVLFSVGPFKECFPTAPPIQGCRWPLKPHGVTIAEPESSKQRSEGVGYERTVEPREISGSDHDRDPENEGYNERPDHRLNDFAFHRGSLQEDLMACHPCSDPGKSFRAFGNRLA
jgi:hypothetical protein